MTKEEGNECSAGRASAVKEEKEYLYAVADVTVDMCTPTESTAALLISGVGSWCSRQQLPEVPRYETKRQTIKKEKGDESF